MIAFTQTIPIFRIFDVAKAKEFYVDFVGCTVDFEHRFEPGLPLYMQVSRAGLTVHLSEHHGDATPGSTALIKMTGIDALHAELHAKGYNYLFPGIEEQPWGRVMQLLDPFGNRLRLMEG
ncbi:MAG TPA: glyoxalase superfamily protein [Candidatus Baltobacteraceae bacterium]|jgi:ribosomal-protein-alanine N-acetyltransferase|nr:glyoxalase superfamily protein [Candidatus Baltobacteraceae bacterium]